MLWGAVVGLVIGLAVGVLRALFARGSPCPHCGKPLPVPWFTPLKECPTCGAEVAAGPGPSSRGRTGANSVRTSWVPVILLGIAAVGGLVFAGLVLPAALESRRVWLYQSGRVEELQREASELRGRQDPESRRRLAQFEEQARSLNPETFREEYEQKLLFIGVGLGCFLACGLAAYFFWPQRRRQDIGEADEADEGSGRYKSAPTKRRSRR